jgi:hypothetical protein
MSVAFAIVCAVAAVPAASAAVMPVGIGAFQNGSVLTTFTGLPTGTEVSGLTVDGILFQYSSGSGTIAIGVGPNTTVDINPPAVVSNPGSNISGTVTMILPGRFDTFGYGYALLSNSAILNATAIAIFDGSTPVGSLSYGALPNPAFAGGFAGIQSTLPFNRVAVTFNASAAPAFAFDNVRRGPAIAVPEPSTLMLLCASALGLHRARARRPLGPVGKRSREPKRRVRRTHLKGDMRRALVTFIVEKGKPISTPVQ